MNVPSADFAAIHNHVVLVIEDNAELRFLISDTLRNANFKVIEAANTDEAAAYLRTPYDVHLIFTDIVMPGKMDGLAFAQMVKKEHPAVKIILTSGVVSPEELPPDMMVIRKPYILARVVAEVRNLLHPPSGT